MAEPVESTLKRIPYNIIYADHSQNPRDQQQYAEDDFFALVKSIKEEGLHEPIVVAEWTWNPDPSNGYQYIVLAGHRRHRAFSIIYKDMLKKIKKDNSEDTSIPSLMIDCKIRNVDKENYFAEILKHQFGIADFKPTEKSRAMLRLRDEYGKTDFEIAKVTNKDKAKVGDLILLNMLPDEAFRLLDSPDCRETNAINTAKFIQKYSNPAHANMRKQAVEYFCKSYAGNTEAFRSALTSIVENFTSTKDAAPKGAVSKQVAEVKASKSMPGNKNTSSKPSGAKIPGLTNPGKSAASKDKEDDSSSKIIEVITKFMSDPDVKIVSEEKIRKKLTILAGNNTNLKEIMWTIKKIFEISEEDVQKAIISAGKNKSTKPDSKTKETTEEPTKKVVGFRKPVVNDDEEEEEETTPRVVKTVPTAPKPASPRSALPAKGLPIRRMKDEDDDDFGDD